MAITCARCGSERIADVNAKCSDLCNIWVRDKEHNGYVPGDLGIGGGDYVEFSFCMGCGQMMGKFPLPPAKIEADKMEKPLDEDFLKGLFKQ
jgi:hypothetical protein